MSLETEGPKRWIATMVLEINNQLEKILELKKKRFSLCGEIY